MKFVQPAETTGSATRSVAVCLSSENGGRFDLRETPRSSPAAGEIEVAVEAASVNPIDVRRAGGYGRRLLSLLGASRFPLTLGNDFVGTVVAVGPGAASSFAVGDRVYGLKPTSRDGSHASHLIVKAIYARKVPSNRNIRELAALPYCFVTMWLAAKAAGLTPENARGKKVLVNGAAGGLGSLAVQTLSAWGARVTAIAKPSDFSSCLAAGAVEVLDPMGDPFADLRGGFDVTLNFAAWDDEWRLLPCLREGALGHATTVHPLMRNFDEGGWLGGVLQTVRQKREMRKRLPKGTRQYAWVLFRPDQGALSEMARLLEAGRLSLPIGIQVPLGRLQEAIDYVRRRAGGRALLLP